MRNAKRKAMIISTIVIAIVIMGYICYSITQYPQIEIDQNTLYGEGNQNLKDFDIVGNGLMSVSTDPWIDFYLNEPIKIKMVKLNISGVTEKGSWGDVYSRKDNNWERQSYDLQNGEIILWFSDKEETDSLRFDLASTNSTYLEIGQIIINSSLEIVCEILKNGLLILIYILIYIEELFLLLNYIKKNNIKKRKKIFTIISMLSPVVLFGTFFYCYIFKDISNALSMWMYMLSIMEMVIVIYRLGSERKYLFINFIDMFVIAFINIGIVETLSGIEFSFENPIALFLNIFFALFPIVLVGGLLRSIKWGMISGNIIFVIIAIINHYFYIFRNQPFELVDFLMANTALTILDSYVFEMDYKILFLILIELGIICYFSLCGREKSNRKELYALIILGILIVITGIAYSPALNYWDMEVCVKENGYINTFVAYAKNDFFHDKPEEYSIFEVKNILENYSVEQKGETAEEYPNIIVIMNEAFSDLPDTYGFETSEDSMPYIHSLNENTIKGNILVSIFGGNTANTEYEFLTGNTMAFMGGRDVPYMQFVKREQVNSLVYELKSLNYQTIAFHPCIPQNYNRDKVYPLLGFDEFVSQNNELAYNENIRAWMSDRADFNNVIDIFEHRDKQKPFFLFNVTMQNHGGYSTYQSDIDITVKPIKEEYQYMQLMEYLSLIKETDAAFEEFINYFENVDEKTIILMFGDHQPGLNADVYDALNYGKETATQQTYTVPFIMWANYEIESRDNVLTSPNYLRTMLLKTGEIPLSCYDQFLLECYNQYPAINKLGYYDNNGNCYTISETLPKRLRDYQVLQYANVFDKTATKYFDIWNN